MTTSVDILEAYDPISGATLYTASCLTPLDPETRPTQARVSGVQAATEEAAIESLRGYYAEYVARPKARYQRRVAQVEF